MTDPSTGGSAGRQLTLIERKLVAAGVKNLHEFGYPRCTSENILTDQIYSAFFDSMLDSNRGHDARIDTAIDALKARIACQTK